MANKTTPILLLLLVLSVTVSAATAQCTASDMTALTSIRNSFPANSFANSWYTQSNCCFWDGVTCAKQSSGRVTGLFLNGAADDSSDILPSVLSGPIPPAIGDLSALTSLSLSSQPGLTGAIPNNLGKLTQLKYFTIYNTSVSGPIPAFFPNFPALLELEINYSQLSGSIPSNLGSLVNLQSIDFSNNKLTGTIPATLFSKMKKGDQAELGLSNNMLTGAIPQAFASVKWENFDVSNNMLCGPIPTGGNFPPADGSGFANNKCLCGSPLPPCKTG